LYKERQFSVKTIHIHGISNMSIQTNKLIAHSKTTHLRFKDGT